MEGIEEWVVFKWWDWIDKEFPDYYMMSMDEYQEQTRGWSPEQINNDCPIKFKGTKSECESYIEKRGWL